MKHLYPEEEPQWQPITMLPFVRDLIDEQIKAMSSLYEDCAPDPQSVDTETIDRLLHLATAVLEDADHFEEQLERWRGEQLTTGQRREVERLLGQMVRFRAESRNLLKLGYTIAVIPVDRVLRKTALKAGLSELVDALQGRPDAVGQVPPVALPSEVTVQTTLMQGGPALEFTHARLGFVGCISFPVRPGGFGMNGYGLDPDMESAEPDRQVRALFGAFSSDLMNWLAQLLRPVTM